jgi:hypothetical protein
VAATAFGTGTAQADGPGVGTPTIASVGDSYISGEAGRWAGNTNNGSQYVDALGATAYFDNASNTAEQITRCHRSKAAEVYVGGGVNGVNLACSGARTSTFTDSDGNFKPGLDFYSDANGKKGQALLLQEYAATHNVRQVELSIGGNNFNFAGIIQSCVTDFLGSPTWWKDYCYDDSSVTANFTSSNISTQTTAIKNAILNVRQAMTNAGYASSQYTIVVQDYESPVPGGSGIRYSESGYTRQSTGGCGFWNADADWANNTALPTINNAVKNAASQTGLTNVKILELQTAFNGRGCARTRSACSKRRACPPGRAPARWTERVGRPDPHRVDGGPDYYSPGVAAPELLGRARAAQLRAPGLQRGHAARRDVHDRGDRPHERRRAAHDAAVALGRIAARPARPSGRAACTRPTSPRRRITSALRQGTHPDTTKPEPA